MHRYFEPPLRKTFLDLAVRNNWPLIRGTAIFCGVSRLAWAGLALLRPWEETAGRDLWGNLWFCLALIVWAAAALAVERLLKKQALVWNYRAQQVLASLFLGWYVLFGLYDVSRFVSMGKIGMETGLIAFAALLMMEPLYGVVNLGAGYGIMLGALCLAEEWESAWNLVVMAVVSLLIFLVRTRNVRQMLQQSWKMKRIHQALEETEEKFLLTNEQYELLLQRGRLIAFEWNIRTGTARFTREWAEIFQEPQRIEDLEGYVKEMPLLKPQQREEILSCMRLARQKQTYQKKDLLLPLKNGEERWFELQLAIQLDQAGEPELGVGLLFDIMDQKSRILELQRELSMDNFTRTLNKTALESYAMRRLHEMGPEEQIGMLVLDMDDFKRINDTYGHVCGDYVLIKLGELMNQLAPERARVGRLGGDEFGAILDLTQGQGPAQAYAAALIQEVPKIQWEGRSMPAACSIGIGICKGGTSFLELYSAADKALYCAKRQGKGRYCTAPVLEQGTEPGPAPDTLSWSSSRLDMEG